MSQAGNILDEMDGSSSLLLDLDKLVDSLDQISSTYRDLPNRFPDDFADIARSIDNCLDSLAGTVSQLDETRKRFTVQVSLSTLRIGDE